MILIDTNVIIDFLKGRSSTLDDLLGKEQLAICGIVLAELLHGVNSFNEEQLIKEAVLDFEWIPINDTIWSKLGVNLNVLRKNGLTVPFQDVLLSTLCIEKDMTIATNDKHFPKIKSILPELKIYNPE